MMWLERILHQYEQETFAPSEEDDKKSITPAVDGPEPKAYQLSTGTVQHRTSFEQVVPRPNPEARRTGTRKTELGERNRLHREFWTQLLERAKKQTSLHARRSAAADSWLNAGSGKAGIVYQYRIRMDDAEVALRIRRHMAEENKRIFDLLYAKKNTIERAFGDRLRWPRYDHSRVRNTRIEYLISIGGLQDRDRWPEIQERMIDAMVRLKKALEPEIQGLR